MSDTWQGPGWRKADDGLWYPAPDPRSPPEAEAESEAEAEAEAEDESPPEAVVDAGPAPAPAGTRSEARRSRFAPFPSLPPPPDPQPTLPPDDVPAASATCEICRRPLDVTALRCPRCGERRRPPTAPMPSDDWID